MRHARLYGIYTVTPLHCGTGQAAGAVDLPITRESTTGYPLIPSPGIKGALRAIATEYANRKKEVRSEEGTPDNPSGGPDNRGDTLGLRDVRDIFGPEVGNVELTAGALAVTDARLLLFPARALQSVFFWITCPLVLSRLKRDLMLTEVKLDLPAVPRVAEGQALLSGTVSVPLLGLEDLVLHHVKQSSAEAQEWVELLQRFVPPDEPVLATRLMDHLAIIADADFQDLVERTTQVQARICIDASTGTVKDGALWYEETLPPDSLLYSLLSLEPTGDATARPAKVTRWWKALDGLALRAVQLGGNETIGHGWCWLHPVRD